MCPLSAKTVLSKANPDIIFQRALETAGGVEGVTRIRVRLLFMTEGRVIIVTHGNPRPTGRETAPKGDSGESGLAGSVLSWSALAV